MELGASKEGLSPSRRDPIFKPIHCAKRYRGNAQIPIYIMQKAGNNAHMSLNWLKNINKTKIITLKELADRYGVHRNTMTKWVRDYEDTNERIDFKDFFSLYKAVLFFDESQGILSQQFKYQHSRKYAIYELLTHFTRDWNRTREILNDLPELQSKNYHRYKNKPLVNK